MKRIVLRIKIDFKPRSYVKNTKVFKNKKKYTRKSKHKSGEKKSFSR